MSVKVVSQVSHELFEAPVVPRTHFTGARDHCLSIIALLALGLSVLAGAGALRSASGHQPSAITVK